MAGGEGSKKVLEIPIDDSQWQAFLKSFRDYQDALGSQSQAWASTNAGIKKMGNAFEDAESAFDDIVDAAQSPKLGKAFINIGKSSKETEKSWLTISKTLEKSAKDMSGLMRDGSKLASLFSLIGLGGPGALAAGAFAGARNANNDLADQNLLNRKLGLKPGEEKAFNNVYEKAGGDTALLSKISTAKANPSDWRYLLAAGISMQDIQTKDPAELAEDFMRNASAKQRQMGKPQFGMYAQATGLTNIADIQSLQAMGSYNDADYAGMHQQYAQLTPQLAAQQKDLDAATSARQQVEAALAKDALELDKAFLKLDPLVISVADKVTSFITAFAESDKLDSAIKETTDGFSQLATMLAKLGVINDNTKGKDGGMNPAIATANDWGKATSDWMEKNIPGFGRWRDSVSGAVNNFTGAGTSAGTSGSGIGGPKNNPGNLRVPGSKTGFQQFDSPDAGVLAMDRQIQLYARRDHLYTLDKIISKYAPSSENATASYIKDVARRTGFDPSKPLNLDDPKTRAALESAMIAHENGAGKYSGMTSDHIGALIGGKGGEDFTDRLTRAAQMLRDSVSEGGGSAFRSDERTQQRIDRQGNQAQSPFSIHVTVTAPAGSSTAVTAGGLPQ